jgi:quercetin dioxygenase-like cupin family protein
MRGSIACKMRRLDPAVAMGVWLAFTASAPTYAQQPAIKRNEPLKSDLAGMEGKEMNIWTADLAPGAATGRHHHPTPRFVIVLEASVVLEIEGRPSQTFKVGQAFRELPGIVHNFKNASATEPAKAIGIQHSEKGQPLQIDVR